MIGEVHKKGRRSRGKAAKDKWIERQLGGRPMTDNGNKKWWLTWKGRNWNNSKEEVKGLWNKKLKQLTGERRRGEQAMRTLQAGAGGIALSWQNKRNVRPWPVTVKGREARDRREVLFGALNYFINPSNSLLPYFCSFIAYEQFEKHLFIVIQGTDSNDWNIIDR